MIMLSGALALASCKDKPEDAASASQAESKAGQSSVPGAPVPAAEEPAKEKPAASLDERAKILGFAKHLPKDISVYSAVLNGRKSFDQLVQSPLGVFLMERLEDEGLSLEDLANELGSEELGVSIAAYSEEYFSAAGTGSDEAVGIAMNFLERLSYYGARFAVNRLDQFVAANGEPFSSTAGMLLSGPFKGAPKELVAMFGQFEMPAYYQGAKVSNEESRARVKEGFDMMASVFEHIPVGVEGITVKRGGAEFSGYKLVGQKLAEAIDDKAVKNMQEVMDLADIQAFKKSLASKNFVIMTGEINDYVILFVGKSEEDFRLVEDVKDSLCASDHIGFVDDYLANDLLLVGFRDDEVYKGASNFNVVLHRILGSVADGMSDALAQAGSLGDTSEIEVLLDALGEQGRGIAAMFTEADMGYVAYLEEGLKVEGFGGSNMPELDFDASHTMASMGSGDGVVMFANWASNPVYNERLMEYLDTLGETGYLMAKRVSSINEGGASGHVFGQFKPGIDMFDQMFRDDLLGIWQALRGDMAAGLGSETALVVDLNGTLPKVPQVPEVILKNGKMPRFAYASTVDDRDKLKQSWKKLNQSIENILKKAGELSGGEIPMQIPMSSEKNNLTTWFIPIPFQNDDFVPSVSVSDNLFFASTSKKFSENLEENYNKGGAADRKGAWLHVDFKVLSDYAKDWFNLIDENLDEIDQRMGTTAREDLDSNKEMFEVGFKALESLDELILNIRHEDGQVRSSLHIKSR